jgi:hypothetical protein
MLYVFISIVVVSVRNTLSYSSEILITAVKIFMVQAPAFSLWLFLVYFVFVMNKHGLKYEGGDLVKLQVGYLKNAKINQVVNKNRVFLYKSIITVYYSYYS